MQYEINQVSQQHSALLRDVVVNAVPGTVNTQRGTSIQVPIIYQWRVHGGGSLTQLNMVLVEDKVPDIPKNTRGQYK